MPDTPIQRRRNKYRALEAQLKIPGAFSPEAAAVVLEIIREHDTRITELERAVERRRRP